MVSLRAQKMGFQMDDLKVQQWVPELESLRALKMGFQMDSVKVQQWAPV